MPSSVLPPNCRGLAPFHRRWRTMMRDAESPVERRHAPRVAPMLLAAAVLVSAVAYAVTRANEAVAIADDPARIAEQALDGKFDAAVAKREIEAALAAHDVELAQSFVDL